MRFALAVPLLAIVLPLTAAAPSTCETCHSALGGDLAKPAQKIKDDIHIKNGLTCASCHGGDPSSFDPTVAMGPEKGFLGKVNRAAIPELCGRCHSDAGFMHKIKPEQRIDQLSLYRAGVHGLALSKGDTAVAVCTDCHSVHDIRDVKTALTSKSAGEAGLGRACGKCHVVFQELFDQSPHKPVFEAMGTAGCTVCHSNHEIKKPTLEMLGVGTGAVCATCHSQGDPGYAAAQSMRLTMDRFQTELSSAEETVKTAERSGMEMSDARLQLVSANEEWVKALTRVHRFQAAALDEPVKAGLAAAQTGHRLGVEALQERDVRRRGLLFSLAAILLTIAGLWLLIRRIERTGKAADVSPE